MTQRMPDATQALDDPDIAHDLAIIRAWAESEPIVHRVWLFGSRVRRDHTPGSDLDVAVEHGVRPGDEDARTTAIAERQVWISQLQPSMCLRLDLQSYRPAETPTVCAGIRRSSLLIFERAP